VIIFDLDGTLLDVWERYFFVFNSWWKIENLDLETFKTLKRRFEQDSMIVNLFRNVSEQEYESYREYKREKLEDPSVLELDRDIVDWSLLDRLKEKYIILTLRRNHKALLEDLKKRNESIVDNVVALKPNGDLLIKYNWVKNNVPSDEEITVVGDSETDLLIGKQKQVHVFLVKTGLRDPDMLIKKFSEQLFGKVFIVNSVNDFLYLYLQNPY
jgi:phosphoglycolate phosphatase